MTNEQTHRLPSPDDVVFFDIEADGFNPTRIHCVVTSLNGELNVFTNRADFADYQRSNAGRYWSGHNALGYDVRVLQKLWGADLPKHMVVDTLVLSRLADPSRSGGHSLANWGQLLGFPKGDYDGGWKTYTPEMLEYCKQDVRVLEKLYSAVLKELDGFDPRSVEVEHKVAEIIHTQIRNGWLLDQGLCFQLLAILKEKKNGLEDSVREVFKPRALFVREITPKRKKDGQLSAVGLKYLGNSCLDIVGGCHSRIEWQEFNLGSRKQIGERLMSLGWVPNKFTPTEQPIVSEDELEHVKGIPEATLIAEYLMVQKRIAQIQSWLDAVDDDGRVRGYVNSNGAVTGRMTHSDPNLAQVPASRKPYGNECRSCWTVPEGRKLVGCDAEGLELRMLAHYMNDDKFTNAVVHGTKENGDDPHTINQKAAGLASRDDAKTFIYAFLYGAGDAKIGSIVGGSRDDGAKLKQRFLNRTPALNALRESVSRAARRGWLRGLDGRRIAVRSEHAALNTLLQGAGALIMKQALINLVRYADAQGLDYKLVGNIHDEIQAEVAAEHAEAFGKCAAYAISQAGRDYNLRCPLAGQYAIGTTWKDTH